MAKQKLFYFQAYDQRQQWQKGSLVAQSKQAAQFLLIAKGFNHIRLQQDWQLNQKPKNAEISALLNQLATLLSSAIPLKNALHILQDNCTFEIEWLLFRYGKWVYFQDKVRYSSDKFLVGD
jgi:protein transport protein HofC